MSLVSAYLGCIQRVRWVGSLVALCFSVLMLGVPIAASSTQSGLASMNYLPLVFRPRDQYIAFISDRSVNFEIYRMDPNGANQINLTNNPTHDFGPRWSPDGSKIAFVSSLAGGSPQVYVMNADGSGRTPLTASSGGQNDRPAWSPDGSKIAFVSTRDGDLEIYVMNADGSGQTRLTQNASLDDDPAWSPDGSKIVFYQYDRINHPEFAIMNAEGSGQKRLTSKGLVNGQPHWSPDGSKIAFIAYMDKSGSDIFELGMINADGTGEHTLTATKVYKEGLARSPDGGTIAFTVGDLPRDLYLISPAGTGMRRLVQDVGPSMSWSSTSQRLVFSSTREGNSEIYAINADGSGLARLTHSDVADFAPVWSP